MYIKIVIITYAVFDNLNKNYIDDIVAYVAAIIVIKIAKVIISCDICKQQIIRQRMSFQITNLKKS